MHSKYAKRVELFPYLDEGQCGVFPLLSHTILGVIVSPSTEMIIIERQEKSQCGTKRCVRHFLAIFAYSSCLLFGHLFPQLLKTRQL